VIGLFRISTGWVLLLDFGQRVKTRSTNRHLRFVALRGFSSVVWWFRRLSVASRPLGHAT